VPRAGRTTLHTLVFLSDVPLGGRLVRRELRLPRAEQAVPLANLRLQLCDPARRLASAHLEGFLELPDKPSRALIVVELLLQDLPSAAVVPDLDEKLEKESVIFLHALNLSQNSIPQFSASNSYFLALSFFSLLERKMQYGCIVFDLNVNEKDFHLKLFVEFHYILACLQARVDINTHTQFCCIAITCRASSEHFLTALSFLLGESLVGFLAGDV
jgi:hypothetical protein